MAVRALLRVARKNLVCRVCYALLRSPVVFLCGHVFCKTCAERSIEERPRCPLCNHAVTSRRVITPLPALARLMGLVHDVAKSLRQRQTAHAAASAAAAIVPSLRLTGAAISKHNGGGNTAGDRRSFTATVSNRSSLSTIASLDDDTGMRTPIIRRCGSTLETQLLHSTPPPPAVMGTDAFVAPDDVETQCVFSEKNTINPASSHRHSCHQCVAVRRGGDGRTLGAAERIGCCVLCAFDIKDRAQICHFLRCLREKDPSCDWARLQQLSEVTLSDSLGPMWDLHLTAAGAGEKGEKKPPAHRKRGRNGGHPPSSALLVHQACLEWCVLRRCVGGATTVTMAISDTLGRQLDGSASAVACSFCEKSSGRCLVPCGRCQRKAYHYPCALLTGARVCVILETIGVLLCAACTQEQQ